MIVRMREQRELTCVFFVLFVLTISAEREATLEWAAPLTYRSYGHSPYYGSRVWKSGTLEHSYTRASHGYYSSGTNR